MWLVVQSKEFGPQTRRWLPSLSELPQYLLEERRRKERSKAGIEPNTTPTSASTCVLDEPS